MKNYSKILVILAVASGLSVAVALGVNPSDPDQKAFQTAVLNSTASLSQDITNITCSSQFPDVNNNTPLCVVSSFMKSRGIFSGDGTTGHFRFADLITRAEAVKVIVTALYPQDVAQSAGRTYSERDFNFSDLPSGNIWYFPYLKIAVDKGIISGHDDGTFRPQSYLNRAEFSKILSNSPDAIHARELKGDQFSDYLRELNIDDRQWYADYLASFMYLNRIYVVYIQDDGFLRNCSDISCAGQNVARDEVAGAFYTLINLDNLGSSAVQNPDGITNQLSSENCERIRNLNDFTTTLNRLGIDWNIAVQCASTYPSVWSGLDEDTTASDEEDDIYLIDETDFEETDSIDTTDSITSTRNYTLSTNTQEVVLYSGSSATQTNIVTIATPGGPSVGNITCKDHSGAVQGIQVTFPSGATTTGFITPSASKSLSVRFGAGDAPAQLEPYKVAILCSSNTVPSVQRHLEFTVTVKADTQTAPQGTGSNTPSSPPATGGSGSGTQSPSPVSANVSLSLNPSSLTVPVGSSVTTTLFIQRTNYNGAVSLSSNTNGISFNPATIPAGTSEWNSSIVTYTVSPNMEPGESFSHVITGIGSGVSSNATLSGTFSRPQGTFTVSTNPQNVTLKRGGPAVNVTVTVNRSINFPNYGSMGWDWGGPGYISRSFSPFPSVGPSPRSTTHTLRLQASSAASTAINNANWPIGITWYDPAGLVIRRNAAVLYVTVTD